MARRPIAVEFLEATLHAGNAQALNLLPGVDPGCAAPADTTLPVNAVRHTNKMLRKVRFVAIRSRLSPVY